MNVLTSMARRQGATHWLHEQRRPTNCLQSML